MWKIFFFYYITFYYFGKMSMSLTRRNGQDLRQNVFIFLRYSYSTSLEDIVNKKARKTCNILNEYTVVVVLLINYGLYTLACFEIYSYVNSAYYIV